MNKFQRNAYFNEFPFLTEGDEPIVPNHLTVEEFKVNRITKELLSIVPLYDGATGCVVGIEDSKKIFLLDKEGKVLSEVQQAVSITHNEAHTDDEEYDGETVGEALLGLNPDDVHYIVTVHTGYKINDHYSVGGYSVIVSKLPKGFTLAGWLEEEENRAKKMVSAIIAEVDAV